MLIAKFAKIYAHEKLVFNSILLIEMGGLYVCDSEKDAS